jgi:DNA-binding IclR family transcriptional regulator
VPDATTGEPVARPAAASSKTLRNGIRLLQVLAANHGGLLVSELARELDIHRTAVYRLLGTLEQDRLVVQRESGRYELGLGVLALTGAVRSNLQDAAQAPLRRLAAEVGATAFLTVLDGADAVCVLVVEPPTSLMHVAYRVGQRHPVHLGPGRAILIGRPPSTAEPAAITKDRPLGYVVTQDELQLGAWGLTAPVTSPSGPAEAAVGVVALTALDEDRIAPLVIRATREVAGALA